MSDEPDTEGRPRWPVEIRRVESLQVRYPERIIELVAVPYDTDAPVIIQDRPVLEQIARGAFDGVERRANRVKLYLGHPPENRSEGTWIGKATALHPGRPEGLVAELLIGRGPERDQILDDAADGILDASVGFAVDPAADEWSERRSRRRVGRAFLDHIALVPDPAYEGAKVLAVRRGENAPTTPTPYLDRIRAERMATRYGLDQ